MDLSLFSLDTATVGAAGLIMVTALSAIWAIKEGVSMFRSRK